MVVLAIFLLIPVLHGFPMASGIHIGIPKPLSPANGTERTLPYGVAVNLTWSSPPDSDLDDVDFWYWNGYMWEDSGIGIIVNKNKKNDNASMWYVFENDMEYKWRVRLLGHTDRDTIIYGNYSDFFYFTLRPKCPTYSEEVQYMEHSGTREPLSMVCGRVPYEYYGRGPHEKVDYIIEREPLINTFISVPKDKGSLNCAAFTAGIIDAVLNASNFPCSVNAVWHNGTT